MVSSLGITLHTRNPKQYLFIGHLLISSSFRDASSGPVNSTNLCSQLHHKEFLTQIAVSFPSLNSYMAKFESCL